MVTKFINFRICHNLSGIDEKMSGYKLRDSQNYLVPSTPEGEEDFAGKELVGL